MKEVKMGMERMGEREGGERVEITWPPICGVGRRPESDSEAFC